MLPAQVVTCGQMGKCPCYRFFEILLSVFTEEYEEDGQEAAKYVVTTVPVSFFSKFLIGAKHRKSWLRLLFPVLMIFVQEAKVSASVVGTTEGLLVTLRDSVLEREAIIVVDINAIREADSEMREVGGHFFCYILFYGSKNVKFTIFIIEKFRKIRSLQDFEMLI